MDSLDKKIEYLKQNKRCPICDEKVRANSTAGGVYDCSSCSGWLLACYVCNDFVAVRTDRFNDGPPCTRCGSSNSANNGTYIFEHSSAANKIQVDNSASLTESKKRIEDLESKVRRQEEQLADQPKGFFGRIFSIIGYLILWVLFLVAVIWLESNGMDSEVLGWILIAGTVYGGFVALKMLFMGR